MYVGDTNSDYVPVIQNICKFCRIYQFSCDNIIKYSFNAKWREN